jgi:hypothetical protein
MFQSPDEPWEIVTFTRCGSAYEVIDALDRWPVDRFLRQFKSDYWVMADLRRLLAPLYSASRFNDDQVIQAVVSGLISKRLVLRRIVRRETTAGSGGGAQGSQPAEAQQSAPAKTVSEPSSRKRSWFSVTVMHEVDGAQKPVNGLTLTCHLPDLGETSGVTSGRASQVRFDDLNPGGTGDVLATSHDEVVWEVSADIE